MRLSRIGCRFVFDLWLRSTIGAATVNQGKSVGSAAYLDDVSVDMTMVAACLAALGVWLFVRQSTATYALWAATITAGLAPLATPLLVLVGLCGSARAIACTGTAGEFLGTCTAITTATRRPGRSLSRSCAAIVVLTIAAVVRRVIVGLKGGPASANRTHSPLCPSSPRRWRPDRSRPSWLSPAPGFTMASSSCASVWMIAPRQSPATPTSKQPDSSARLRGEAPLFRGAPGRLS